MSRKEGRKVLLMKPWRMSILLVPLLPDSVLDREFALFLQVKNYYFPNSIVAWSVEVMMNGTYCWVILAECITSVSSCATVPSTRMHETEKRRIACQGESPAAAFVDLSIATYTADK